MEGYANVSIRKIAERFLALADEGFHRLDAKVRAAMVSGDPLENVRACWWAFYEFAKKNPSTSF